LAAGFAAGALGTDTMGSVRIPAAYCGVCSLKPTYGVVSQRGLRNLSFTLDHIGPMARRIEDVAAIFGVIAAPDPLDPYAVDRRPAAQRPVDLAGLTLGRLRFEDQVEVEPGVHAAFEAALGVWRRLGVRIIDVRLQDYVFAAGRRHGLLISEAEGAHVLAGAMAADPQGFSPQFARLLAYGRDAPAVRLAAAYDMVAHARRTARLAFEVCDALVSPTAPQAAFAHETPAPVNQADFTAFANFAGVPAVAVPMGRGREDLPVSLQIMTPWFADRLALDLAQRFAGVGAKP
jgi:aspartyl-tRNA(Asn)/glutamyl-tRNA(Gln) amidotransferase subunit A